MGLAERIQADRERVFMQHEHFATKHTWNGKPFYCVADEEMALKRKNNNVNDISWDNNTEEVVIHVPEEEFPGKAKPNTHGYFDGEYMRILQVQSNMGMLEILLVTNVARAVDE